MEESLAADINRETDEGVKQLYYKVWEHRLESAWKQFMDAGFEPLLIKGWAAAQFYPNPWDRQFVDIDLMFEPTAFEAAQEFINTNTTGILVDLHRGARHLDELPFEDLYRHSVLKDCGKSKIRVPCDEDHLRILCVHWLNDGGVDKKRLEDIFYAVTNRREDFDWERCLNSVSSKRRRWVTTVIVLTHQHLDLPIENIPLKDNEKNIPKWLEKTLEIEWTHDIRLKPLHSTLNNRAEFWQQLQKRLLPNPIQATIETDGAIDNKPRIIYQLVDIVKRAYPSIKRIYQTYLNQFKRR